MNRFMLSCVNLRLRWLPVLSARDFLRAYWVHVVSNWFWKEQTGMFRMRLLIRKFSKVREKEWAQKCTWWCKMHNKFSIYCTFQDDSSYHRKLHCLCLARPLSSRVLDGTYIHWMLHISHTACSYVHYLCPWALINVLNLVPSSYIFNHALFTSVFTGVQSSSSLSFSAALIHFLARYCHP